MEARPLAIFAAGSPDADGSGGSGLLNYIDAVRHRRLRAELTVAVSSHEHGSVRKMAETFGIGFFYMPPPYTEEHYQEVFELLKRKYGWDFISFSGWLKIVRGCDPQRMFNIHPGPLPITQGLWGERLHRRTLAAFEEGAIDRSEIVMHFMTETVDDERGIFFRAPFRVKKSDSWKSLQKRGKKMEHRFQPLLTECILEERIRWDGTHAESMVGRMILP